LGINSAFNSLGSKAELQQEGIFFPHPFTCQRNIVDKEVGN
jgi:hypothetical protein